MPPTAIDAIAQVAPGHRRRSVGIARGPSTHGVDLLVAYARVGQYRKPLKLDNLAMPQCCAAIGRFRLMLQRMVHGAFAYRVQGEP